MRDFDWADVSATFSWEGRPAVEIRPADGSISGRVVPTGAAPGAWETASPVEIRESGRILSMTVFQETFADRIAES